MEVNDALNPFVSFPIELNLHILSYVPDADLIKRISLVCHQFKELSNDQIQWKERTIRLCGKVKAEQSFSETKDWKLSYILGPDGSISELKEGVGNFSGKRIRPSKIEEIGEFQNYLLIKGSRTQLDGTVYEGQYINDTLNGQGKKVCPDGAVYTGQFINDKLNGPGTINFRNRIVHEGEFKNDKLNGQGKKISPDGIVYEGQYINDTLNGQGKINFCNRIVYEGEFKNDKLNGQGKINFRNGTVYTGQFINDKLNGQGKINFRNGKVYTGHFINDKLNGPGKITHPNGIVYEGEFKNGKLNGQAYGTKAKECSSRTC